ncbi:MAG TPA: beta-L-arabinofuranosidase domain-containing protein [Fimbriimonadaceae bacterium]|nr:beta-L-arabinofuranosidase domain-containing protein [Fimbriimonadaceae bacterium]
MVSLFAAILFAPDPTLRFVDVPPSGGKNAYYVGNRAPLEPTPFRTLPVGTVKPRGWVLKQLELEADGFTGHLEEISGFLKHDHNAWLSPTGEGANGWEEVPYWLKGFGDLGYVLGDKRIIDDAKFWIEHVMDGQAANGWLGPRSNLVNNNGKPDMWPNMPMLFALQSYYEFSGDKRVPAVMRKYFQWQLALPESDFYLSYWEKQRGGDNLESVLWLYNRTGEPWLLDLAKKIHRRTAPWAQGVPDWHGVNFAQAFREPAEVSILDRDPKLEEATEKDYSEFRGQFGEVPGGMYGADENARKGYDDPRQAAETCAMVEMMYSDEDLLRLTGERRWAERCEDVTFNSLPASMTPDLKALHYLTAPNMPLADARSKSPGLQNSGPMLLFNPWDHRCCQHNVAQGWPYYAEHLWMATDGNGLGAALYAPCEVTAKAGRGTPVTIRESTNYPFGERVELRFTMSRRDKFPLTLRLPSWCDSPSLTLNGKTLWAMPPSPDKPQGTGGHHRAYVIVNRTWKSGDRLTLLLPMHLELTHWKANKDSVSVQRGPLTYSLRIGEKYVRKGGTDPWPAFEIHPTTAWNYGLVPDLKQFKVTTRPMPADGQPFSETGAPVVITAPARLIPEWGLDMKGLVQTLQPSPAQSMQPIQTVTLVPMGAARIRISAFPTVTDRNGHVWKAAPKGKTPIPAKASHVFEGDTLDALSDGLLPKNSGDQSIPRFTWWDHKGGTEWVEYDLPSTKLVDRAEVYWFDDRRTGECRVPESWRLLYWDGRNWVEVQAKTPYRTDRDMFNSVRFAPVVAKSFRIQAKLQDGFSAGILEWALK